MSPIETSRLWVVVLVLLSASHATADDDGKPNSTYEVESELGYESRHISEGSNTVDHGGVAVFGLELGREMDIGNFAVGIEFVTGVSVNYRETELMLEHEKSVGDFTAALSWVRIISEEGEEKSSGTEKEYDTEWGIGFSYDGWEQITPSIEYIHSEEADGELLVLTLEGKIEVGGLELSPYLLTDIDYGYVSDDYDGLNHIEAGIAWEAPVGDAFEMTTHASYSKAQENLRREGEDSSYFWVGINFSL